jgi:hypothetical protein
MYSLQDPCIYINRDTGIIIAIWVDDMVIFGANLEKINEIKMDLSNEFNMKDMRELEYFLGIQIQWDRAQKRITFHQSGYANMILDHFRMQDAKCHGSWF